MLKNKIFCFDENNPVFVEKIGYQIKFCAYVIYEWYLTIQSVWNTWPHGV